MHQTLEKLILEGKVKGQRNKEIFGEGHGGLDGGKCLESGTNSRRLADI